MANEEWVNPTVARFNRAASLVVFGVTVGVPVSGQQAIPVSSAIAQYGWADVSEADGPIAPLDQRYEAGVLGNPVDVAQDADGRVLVLDRAFYKIVVFGPAGEYRGLILGGNGRGPGEFDRARSLSIRAPGDLWAWDQGAARVTRFDQNGEVLETVRPQSALVIDLSVVGAGIYGTRIVRDSSGLVLRFDETGTLISTLAPPSPLDAEKAVGRSGGMVAAIGQGPGESLLIAYPAVGTWAEIRGDHVGPRKGQVLFPDARPVDYQDPRYGVTTVRRLVETHSIGVLTDGRVFLCYSRRDDVEQRPWYEVVLFGADGTYLGKLNEEFVAPVFGSAVDEPALFVYEEDPYPRVIKKRVN